jgi:prolyl 4-hydroxylase
MSQQEITPEVRQWIASEAAAGKTVDTILAGLMASGWSLAVALEALAPSAAAALSSGLPPLATEPESYPVPEPYPADTGSSIVIDGHTIHILMAMRNPRVLVLGNVLTYSECDALIGLAKQSLSPSQTVVESAGGGQVDKSRTSESALLSRGQDALCQRIEARIAKLTDWPLDHGEGLHILRYQRGAQYEPHYDYFKPAQAGTESYTARGGQRVASLIMYLNTPLMGGTTFFPDVDLKVSAIKGNAVFFSYDRPHPMTRTLHAGAPVLEGEKWVATKWLRQRRFD